MKELLGQRALKQELSLDDAQKLVLQKQIDTYNDLWRSVVNWCKKNKTVSRYAAQKALYKDLRREYPDMLSQFFMIVFREGCGAVKSWNSNNPKRRWQLNGTRRSQSVPVDLRLFSLRGNLLTLSTFKGQPRTRVMLPDTPEWFADKYPERTIKAATVHISVSGRPYINLIFEVPHDAPKDDGDVVGVDRGIYKIAVTSKGGEHTGSKVRAQRRRYLHNRKTLQQKGTRSAKRRLRAMSGREKRFMRDVNHQISSELANDESVKTYVLEDLTGIRKGKRGRKGATWINNWSFYQLETFIRYKCEARCIEVLEIDPRYTSQTCNTCGYRHRGNRKKGLFLCKQCGHREDADLNAARNIRDKHILSLPVEGAGLSQHPVMDGVPNAKLPA